MMPGERGLANTARGEKWLRPGRMRWQAQGIW
jgi:hypothetical protein